MFNSCSAIRTSTHNVLHLSARWPWTGWLRDRFYNNSQHRNITLITLIKISMRNIMHSTKDQIATDALIKCTGIFFRKTRKLGIANATQCSENVRFFASSSSNGYENTMKTMWNGIVLFTVVGQWSSSWNCANEVKSMKWFAFCIHIGLGLDWLMPFSESIWRNSSRSTIQFHIVNEQWCFQLVYPIKCGNE